MNEPLFIRVDLGEVWVKSEMMERFRAMLRQHGLLCEDYLYHAFDGVRSLDQVIASGCDVKDPERYSCGNLHGILDHRAGLYSPLDTGVSLEKPGLLVYRRRSFTCISERKGLYRFRGRNYARGLVAILLAKRPYLRRVRQLQF